LAKTFRPYDPEQLLMLPPSLRDWLPGDHLVYFVSDVTETLDLAAIYERYDEDRGYPPYHPLLITKVLLYGYARGVYSSRRLARACVEDVAFRVLCAGNEPDFRTIADFRKRHLDALSGLFVQILELCRAAGLVKLGHVAIDSTKLRANASKHKAMSYGRMQQEEQRLRTEIKRLLARSEAEDAAEDELYGPDKTGDELPEELRRREGRLKKIQEAKAALEQEAKEAAKRKGKPARDAVPEAKAQRNFTDPDSRIMKDSGSKAFVQAYSAQLAVDADSQVIVETELMQASNDKGQLVPMVERVCDRMEETPDAVSADTGYWTEADIAKLEWYEIPAYVATKKIRHSEWREAEILPEPIPEGLSRKERMSYLLRTQRGRAEFDKRKQTVEPVIGQIKAARGFRQLLLRGLPKVRGEWRIVCTVHNVLKLFGSGWRPQLGGSSAKLQTARAPT